MTEKEYRRELTKIRINYNIENLQAKLIECLSNGRPVWIWGAVEKNLYIVDFAECFTINIEGFIDRNSDLHEWKGKPVERPENVIYRDIFVIVALDRIYTDVKDFLASKGLKEMADYFYPGKAKIQLSMCEGYYRDIYGNEIRGTVKGAAVLFEPGKGSILILNGNTEIYNNVEIILRNGGILIIGDNVTFEEKCRIDCQGLIIIGNGCRCNASLLCAEKFGIIQLGETSTIERNTSIVAPDFSSIKIGADCMISYSVSFLSSSGHYLFDNCSRQSIEKKEKNDIVVGKHVWIGASAKVFCGADIGTGSVVGMNTFVNKRYPANCALAGIPARVVRENVGWEREKI